MAFFTGIRPPVTSYCSCFVVFPDKLSFVVSGEVPEEPVVAPGSGVIFERRLVEKWIEEYGTDPVRKDLPLAKEQLIQIESEIKNIQIFSLTRNDCLLLQLRDL